MQRFLDAWIYGYTGVIQYTPLGLAWSNAWGSLRFTANAALIAVVYAKHIKGECIHDAAIGSALIGQCFGSLCARDTAPLLLSMQSRLPATADAVLIVALFKLQVPLLPVLPRHLRKPYTPINSEPAQQHVLRDWTCGRHGSVSAGRTAWANIHTRCPR